MISSGVSGPPIFTNNTTITLSLADVLQSVIDHHGLHFAASVSHTSPSHSTGKHLRDLTPGVNMIEEFVATLESLRVVW
jgi:hypothetical protein